MPKTTCPSERKSSLAIAWDDFTRKTEEARILAERGAEWNAIAELLRHARDLLVIIEWEVADSYSVTPSGVRGLLAQLRDRVQSLEKDVIPAQH